MIIIINIFAEVSVPCIDISIEIILPENITISAAIQRISSIVKEKIKVELDTENLILYSIDTAEVLNEMQTVGESPIKDACRLAIL